MGAEKWLGERPPDLGCNRFSRERRHRRRYHYRGVPRWGSRSFLLYLAGGAERVRGAAALMFGIGGAPEEIADTLLNRTLSVSLNP